MPRPRSLTDAQAQALARDWRAGVPVPELIRRYRVSQPTLYCYRRRLDLPKRGWTGRPIVRTYAPRPKRPEPVDFPFRYIPPKPLRAKLWRCDCGQLSTAGPTCGRCATNQEAA